MTTARRGEFPQGRPAPPPLARRSRSGPVARRSTVLAEAVGCRPGRPPSGRFRLFPAAAGHATAMAPGHRAGCSRLSCRRSTARHRGGLRGGQGVRDAGRRRGGVPLHRVIPRGKARRRSRCLWRLLPMGRGRSSSAPPARNARRAGHVLVAQASCHPRSAGSDGVDGTTTGAATPHRRGPGRLPQGRRATPYSSQRHGCVFCHTALGQETVAGCTSHGRGAVRPRSVLSRAE